MAIHCGVCNYEPGNVEMFVNAAGFNCIMHVQFSENVIYFCTHLWPFLIKSTYYVVSASLHGSF